MRAFPAKLMDNGIIGTRLAGDYADGLIVFDIFDNGFKGVIGIHNIHSGVVAAGNIEKMLNCLRIGRVLIALYVKNQ